MRVAYFSNQFAAATGHGMRRYAFELFDAITALGGADLVPAAGWSNLSPDDLRVLRDRSGLQLMGTGRRGTSLAWTLLGAPAMETMMSGPIDVTHAVSMGYPVATRKPLVVTVHDLGPLTHPQFFSNNRPWVMRAALKQAAERAAVVVAISHATADEIRSLHPDVGDRLRVVQSGVSDVFFEPADMAALDGLPLPSPDTPLILTAGKISPRKNVLAVAQALERVADTVPHHLVLTGGDGWDTEAVHAALSTGVLRDRVHQVGFVSDDVLRALYARADIYAHPSLYEGFGLTVLEAMAAGTPVITSNLSSLPEVAGNAAELVDPNDVDAIADAILRIATRDGHAEALSAAGIVRARAFPWENTAQAMIDIYKEAAA